MSFLKEIRSFKIKMKIWLNAFEFAHPTIKYNAQVAAILFSATCVGNDGKRCPLFHASLAPELFSASYKLEFQNLLLLSNNITWARAVQFWFVKQLSHHYNILNTLTNTRYSSRSIKTVIMYVVCDVNVIPYFKFIENHCIALEHFEVTTNHVVGLFDFTFLSTRAQTLVSLDLEIRNNSTASLLSVPFDRLVRLRKLELYQINNAICEHFTKCPSIERLLIWFAYDITDEGFSQLKKLENLRELVFNARITTVSSECLNDTLSSLEFLRKLHISCQSLNAETFRQITGPLDDFRCSSRFDDGITDRLDYEMMEHLCEIKTLKILDFGAVRCVTKAGWEHLTKLPLLQSLLVDTRDLSKKALENICSISSLRRLRFDDTAFTDDWFEQISKLVNLEQLECLAGKFTGSGFHHLYAIKSLRKLDLLCAPNCQIEKVVELQKRMPFLTLNLPRDVEIAVKKYFADEEAMPGTRRERQ
jgi:hypothetical protein